MFLKRLYRKNVEPISEIDDTRREVDLFGDEITHREDYDMRTDEAIEEEHDFEVN